MDEPVRTQIWVSPAAFARATMRDTDPPSVADHSLSHMPLPRTASSDGLRANGGSAAGSADSGTIRDGRHGLYGGPGGRFGGGQPVSRTGPAGSGYSGFAVGFAVGFGAGGFDGRGDGDGDGVAVGEGVGDDVTSGADSATGVTRRVAATTPDPATNAAAAPIASTPRPGPPMPPSRTREPAANGPSR